MSDISLASTRLSEPLTELSDPIIHEVKQEVRRSRIESTPVNLVEANSTSDEDETSGSTQSDFRDVLNCLKYPRDVKHVCRINCRIPKKEDLLHCKFARGTIEDGAVDHDSTDFDMEDAQSIHPVRTTIVHTKDCTHYIDPNNKLDTLNLIPKDSRGSDCEDNETTFGDLNYDIQDNEICLDDDDVGIIKYSVKLIDEPNDEAKEPLQFDAVSMKNELQDILNSVKPPIVFQYNGKLWYKKLSSERSRRAEVSSMIEILDMRMTEWQGKDFELDSVRRHIYDQFFDELIRQEMIDCAERGLLLLRLRDEMKMTKDAWGSLLDHANNFALQRIRVTESSLLPMEMEMEILSNEMLAVGKEMEEFVTRQSLGRFQEKNQWEHICNARKIELAPLLARNKLLKEQIRLLQSQDED